MWNRYFVPDNVLDEVIFGLPRQKSDQKDRGIVVGINLIHVLLLIDN